MAEFAGYNMPISYSGINDEHLAVRSNAGVFDVSHMGEFIIKGEHALDLIQRVTTNDASKLAAGKAQYSALTNERGGIVDDLIVYCLEENKAYMLVVNASNIEKDWKWISAHNTRQAEMHNISDKTCLLAIQGPNATRMMQPLTDVDILNLPYYTFARGKFAGIDNVRFKRQVKPGDSLRLEVELGQIRRNIGTGTGTATVNGEVACKGEFMFAIPN